jgi:hypothetical protein
MNLMNHPTFEIHCRRSRGNLHVQPKGHLDRETAQQLLELIQDRYDGAGLVFVDTGALQEIHPQGADTFKSGLAAAAVVPIPRLFFKGRKGFDMAPEGCRVLVTPQQRCCGGKGGCSGGDCHSTREPSASIA